MLINMRIVLLVVTLVMNGCAFATYNKFDVIDGQKVLVGQEKLNCWWGSCARGDMNATAAARVPDIGSFPTR